MDGCNKTGSVGIGAKGTIVSLMEKELQLEEEEANSRGRKISESGAQMHHLPIRNEVVSVYCRSLFMSNNKGTKNSQIEPEKPAAAKRLVKSGSFKESNSSSSSSSSSPSTYYFREALGRSSSLRDSRSREDLPSQAKILHFTPPKLLGNPRKKVVSYQEAAYSRMLSFFDNDEEFSAEASQQKNQQQSFSNNPTVLDDLVPILGPRSDEDEVAANMNSSSYQRIQEHNSRYYSNPFPGKFPVPPVEIVDTKCYRAGRDLFRPLPKSSNTHKKLSFWKL